VNTPAEGEASGHNPVWALIFTHLHRCSFAGWAKQDPNWPALLLAV